MLSQIYLACFVKNRSKKQANKKIREMAIKKFIK